jgi:hypothetical protein
MCFQTLLIAGHNHTMRDHISTRRTTAHLLHPSLCTALHPRAIPFQETAPQCLEYYSLPSPLPCADGCTLHRVILCAPWSVRCQQDCTMCRPPVALLLQADMLGSANSFVQCVVCLPCIPLLPSQLCRPGTDPTVQALAVNYCCTLLLHAVSHVAHGIRQQGAAAVHSHGLLQ